jgi:hypothetical protein
MRAKEARFRLGSGTTPTRDVVAPHEGISGASADASVDPERWYNWSTWQSRDTFELRQSAKR